MKRILFITLFLAAVLAIFTMVSACGSDAPSHQDAKASIIEYLPSARTLMGTNPYAGVVAVDVLKIGTPFEQEMFGIKSKGWPVIAQLTKSDGSTQEDEFIIFRDSYGEWSAIGF